MWVPTFFFVVLGWVLFRAPDLGSAGRYLASMFGIGSTSVIDDVFLFEFVELRVLLVAAVLASIPWTRFIKSKWLCLAGRLAQIPLFVVSLSCLVMNAYNPFIYFNF